MEDGVDEAGEGVGVEKVGVVKGKKKQFILPEQKKKKLCVTIFTDS